MILNRILDGDDLARDGVEVVERGVKRGGFARPDGAGDQKEPAGLFDGLGDFSRGLGIKAQCPSSGFLGPMAA